MGRPKLSYCIDYRNMYTGIHGLLCYDTRRNAESYLDKILKAIVADEKEKHLSVVEKRPQKSSVLEPLLDAAFVEADNVIDEIDYRDIKEIYKEVKGKTRLVRMYGKDCVIVNLVSVDLYV